MKVTFKNWKCKAVGVYYSNDKKAIKLISVKDGEPIATATVNLSQYTLPDNEVFIKDYSENEGMTQSLIDADIILPDHVLAVKSGFVTIKSYILTSKALKLWQK